MSNAEAVPEASTGETHRAEGWAARAPLLAAIGGCAFAAFWITGAFGIALPWIISLPIHAFAMLTLATGVIFLQKRQIESCAEKDWTWVPALAVAVSVFFSFEVLLISAISFGLTALRLHRLSRSGAILLVAGAVTFALAFAVHGPFWSEDNPEPSTPLAFVFSAGLVLMAAGWVVMATRQARDAGQR